MAKQDWFGKAIGKDIWVYQVNDLKIEVSTQRGLKLLAEPGCKYTLLRSYLHGFAMLCIPYWYLTDWEKVVEKVLSSDSEELEDLSKYLVGWIVIRENIQKVQIVRGPLGRIPFFYRNNSNKVLFSSSSHLVSDRLTLNYRRTQGFLNRWSIFSSEDFLDGVHRIYPGEVIEIDIASSLPLKVRGRFWWKVDRVAKTRIQGQKIADLLTEEIETSWGNADKGPSLALSGGLDSTLLMELMLDMYGKVSTFSMISPPDKSFDRQKLIEANFQDRTIQSLFFDISGILAWKQPNIHNPIDSLGYGPNSMPEQPYFAPFFYRVKEDTDHLFLGVGADQLFQPHTIQRPVWKNILRAMMPQLIEHLPRRAPLIRSPFATGDFPIIIKNEWRNLSPFQTLRLGGGWEMMMRNLERVRRNTGLLLLVPFLTPKIFRYFASADSNFNCLFKNSRSQYIHKAPLRELLDGRSNEDLVRRAKTTSFDEVVKRGLFEHGRKSLLDALINCQSPSYVDHEHLIDWLDSIVLERVRTEEMLFFWRAVSLTLWWNQLLAHARVAESKLRVCENGLRETEI